MSHPLGRIRVILALMLSLTLLAACNSPGESLAEPQARALVQAFATTYEATESVIEPMDPAASATPAISPTPISYLIIAGDTLLGLAERNAISLDALLLANPGIDARFLSIGQEIFIPLAEGSLESSAAVAPDIALNEGNTTCFASVAGELWCFFLVENNQADAVENATAQIQLRSSSGEIISQKDAFGQIQKLDSGEKMPLIAYWNAAPSGWVAASGHLTSAFRLDDPSARYLELELIDFTFSFSDSGKSATVSAAILGAEISASSSIKVLAVAYANDGRVIGTRLHTLTDGENSFVFEIYSLGPIIADVKLLLEGRP